ncbi:16S rRNA (cytosine(1402)-N(4))-methyltransferase RsmH [Patescibacteria group bacterium]|nr:16S rRNA (cytosine(1402)-N(4))-methyltransferase RsmH [Patescibacteria group bacterium]
MRREKKLITSHEPVLVQEVIKYFGLEYAHLKYRRPRVNKKFIDATVGTGGHSTQIIKAGGLVLGIDADAEMLAIARPNLEKACPIQHQKHGAGCFKLSRGNFRNLTRLARKNGFEKVNGVLLDLGVSSIHYQKKSRGFSFDDLLAPLDMRVDRSSQKVKASDLLNSLRRDQLRELFEKTLKKSEARRLSELVILQRTGKEMKTVGDFLNATSQVFIRQGKTHPATRAFLALRIAVNSELENLKEVLPQALAILVKNSRLIVISFHSGEDVIVKKFFKESEKQGVGKILTKNPVIASAEEISRNQKARSAKLRVFQKV